MKIRVFASRARKFIMEARQSLCRSRRDPRWSGPVVVVRGAGRIRYFRLEWVEDDAKFVQRGAGCSGVRWCTVQTRSHKYLCILRGISYPKHRGCRHMSVSGPGTGSCVFCLVTLEAPVLLRRNVFKSRRPRVRNEALRKDLEGQVRGVM
jgi:hypothetical protein